MKKVVGICIFSKHYEDGEPCYQVWNFTVNHNGNSIPLVTYNLDCGPEPYKYHTFNDLYGSLINILKNNGFYTQVSSEFGRDFYNISFIEWGKVGISKLGYEKEGCMFVRELPKEEKLKIYKMVKGCCLFEGYELPGSMRNMLDEKVKDVKDLLDSGMMGYEPINYMEVYKDYSYGRY